jgi:hypothetical protein
MMIIQGDTLVTEPAMFGPDGLIDLTEVAVSFELERVEVVQFLRVVDPELLGPRRSDHSHRHREL